MSASEARRHALAARDAVSLEPTGRVTYQSTGKIIALGDEAALARCDELPDGIDIQPVEVAGEVEIEGYLGAFAVRIQDAGEAASYRGDAILDLSAEPLLARELPPPGYIHAPPGDWQRLDIAAELEGLSGEFEKPKYFDYDASICAHAVNGRTVCSRCIDACPADAIASIGERIEVNPNLCQGGGSCATVCPSGAIRYLYPNLRDNGQRLADMLQAFREHGGERPVVLFHGVGFDPDGYLQAHEDLLPIAAEELASVGPDLCLAAFAYGAAQVVLLVDDEVPQSARATLRLQLDWMHDLLGALGYGSAHLCFCEAGAELPTFDNVPAVEASTLDLPINKRKAILQAVDHLVATLAPQDGQVELARGAPFGAVAIDAAKCTLCMACVGACPGRALQDGSNREVPEVLLVESNCLQCGACVQTCPEDAMALETRMLFDREARNRARVLNSDSPFACIACGKPFAPTSVIHKMQDKLKDHHMFGNQRALDRLKMCDDCRVADIVQDPDAMGGQFDPLKGFRQ